MHVAANAGGSTTRRPSASTRRCGMDVLAMLRARLTAQPIVGVHHFRYHQRVFFACGHSRILQGHDEVPEGLRCGTCFPVR